MATFPGELVGGVITTSPPMSLTVSIHAGELPSGDVLPNVPAESLTLRNIQPACVINLTSPQSAAAPTVLISPANGTLLLPTQVVSVQVFDPLATTNISFVMIKVKLGADEFEVTAYDGDPTTPDPFRGPFAASSVLTPIIGGWQFDLIHDGGWPVDNAIVTARGVAGGGITL